MGMKKDLRPNSAQGLHNASQRRAGHWQNIDRRVR